MNTELFRKIHEEIRLEDGRINEDRFCMDSWEIPSRYSSCGTTRCVAGWAICLTTGKPLFGNRSVLDLADRLDLEADFEAVGADLLELDAEDARKLFYGGEDVAAEFVRLAAEGKEEEALEVLWSEED